MRRKVLVVLITSDREMGSAMVAARCSLPTTSVGRHFEALAAHGVLEKARWDPEACTVSEWTREQRGAVR
ncbi:MAG: helix-turn-helix domain-containing protein [Acidimicrobiales bacterium]|jgi:predicted ArsR family transcriptional regulator